MRHAKDGKNQLDFQIQNFVTGEKNFFPIISKGNIFRAELKKPLYIVNYWWTGVKNYVYFGNHEDLYI